jgi:hypothetical protein
MKSINHAAPVTCSKSIIIHANASKVWEVLINIDHWVSWQSDISKSKLRGTLAAGSNFSWKTGGANIPFIRWKLTKHWDGPVKHLACLPFITGAFQKRMAILLFL